MIDEKGNQVGVVPLEEAKKRAQEANLSLAEVSPNTDPPVCKILDYGKYRYEQTKQLKKQKKGSKFEIKGIRLGIKIGQHDFEVKLNRARKFLEKKDKVKVTLLFRGREITHRELGEELLGKFEKGLSDISKREGSLEKQGPTISLTLLPN